MSEVKKGPIPASRYPIGSYVSFGSIRGRVVERWEYSMMLRLPDGKLLFGGTECVTEDPDLEKLADEALL